MYGLWKENSFFNQLSFEQCIKCQILHTLWYISGGRLKREIWSWSLLIVKGLRRTAVEPHKALTSNQIPEQCCRVQRHRQKSHSCFHLYSLFCKWQKIPRSPPCWQFVPLLQISGQYLWLDSFRFPRWTKWSTKIMISCIYSYEN